MTRKGSERRLCWHPVPLGGCRVEGVGLGDVVVVDARMSVHAHIQHVGMWISG